ncbi:Membrane protein/domain, putative [Vibrio sp. N418]|uniref:RDD family protein n=1 Tax=Vibrio TaxID=662 RepID=UPI00021BF093|nr:RDD family protein [Vibrio sp. N418]EGU31774.1 Membrane protein/domain, putative [Vibrio sp. N418]
MRYGGFWRRSAASLIDGLVLLPFTALLIYAQGFSKEMGIWLSLPAALLFSSYYIIMHWRYGATVGKRLLSLRVVDEYYEREINFRSALLRGSFYLVFAMIFSYWEIIGFQSIPADQYAHLEWYVRDEIVQSRAPSWSSYVMIASCVWFVISFFTLVMTEKKRTLHDYLGSTVVVRVYK